MVGSPREVLFKLTQSVHKLKNNIPSLLSGYYDSSNWSMIFMYAYILFPKKNVFYFVSIDYDQVRSGSSRPDQARPRRRLRIKPLLRQQEGC